MKVLVMGGTQFNGYALVRELLRTGHDVTVLNRGQRPTPLPRSVRRLYADRTDHARVRELLGKEEFDCVQDLTAYQPQDVELMVELLRGRIGHYIFASSTVIYAHSDLPPITEDHPVDRSPRQNEYGRRKLACEDILAREHRERGFPATTVALSMVFGPNNVVPDREQRMFVRLLRGRKILIPGNGTALSQVGYVDDQVRALRLMMTRPITFGKRYNLTGRDCFTDEGYVDTIAGVLGVEPPKVFIPAALMDDLWDGRVELDWGAGLGTLIDIRRSDQELAAFRTVIRQQRLASLVQKLAPHLNRWNHSTFFSTDRLRQDVGWEPEYCFRAMVEQTYEWFTAQGLDRTARFDFGFEDQLLAKLGES